MKNIFKIWLFLAFIFSAPSFSSELSLRMSGDIHSVATLDGSLSAWHNPAGLAFLGGSESELAYRYEWNTLGDRHHAGLSTAFNVFDIFRLALGLNSRLAFMPEAKNNFGSDLAWLLALGFKLGPQASFAMSFFKPYYFLPESWQNTKISFGFQARPWSFLALGAMYQEINEGFFKAPVLQTGIGLRPFTDILTFSLDAKFKPRGKEWEQGFRFDPIFGVAFNYQGIKAIFNTEIPGLKEGFKDPLFFAGLEFNFGHLGLSLNSHVHPHRENYSLGGAVKAFSEERSSLKKPENLWVELEIDSQGNLAGKNSFWSSFLNQNKEPLAVLSLLKRIENDPAIKGLIIKLNPLSLGGARAQEWRDALAAITRAKKEVVVFLDSPSERDYYVATGASKIFMNKNSSLSLHRFQTTLIYLADSLEKIGIKAEAIAAGSFKTAPRMWTHAQAQEEELLVYRNILHNFYESFLDESSTARNIDKSKLKEIFDQGEVSAKGVKDFGLVDGAIHYDEIYGALSQDQGLPIWRGYAQRQIHDRSWGQRKKIAVLHIQGEIADGRISPPLLPIFGMQTGAQDVADAIEEILADPLIAGLIVRINSPGGDALAGNKIFRTLSKAQEKIPVVASMADVAASAGYLIAAGASHIIAEPSTITGSIGVFSLYFSGEGLAKKIGLNSFELSELKNPGSTIYRPMTDKEKEQGQKLVDWYYDNFVSEVAASLELSQEEIRKNAEGRVWLGHEAFARKLVHELGGFDKAILSVKQIASIPLDEEIDLLFIRPGTSENFGLSSKLISLFSKPNFRGLEKLEPITRPVVQALQSYQLEGVPQARLPFNLYWP